MKSGDSFACVSSVLIGWFEADYLDDSDRSLALLATLGGLRRNCGSERVRAEVGECQSRRPRRRRADPVFGIGARCCWF